MLNHAGNSYITRRKQLCHPPDTIMSHRKQLYHPLMYLFCILIRSDSRSNVAVAKQSKQRSGIINGNKEYAISVFHFNWLLFYLKMSHNIYHMSSRATLPVGDTKALARYHPLPSASGDVTHQGFRVTSWLIFWNVTLEAMWYMYNVVSLDLYVDLSHLMFIHLLERNLKGVFLSS